MFTLNDFWKIFGYLDPNTSLSDLEDNVKAVAKSELAKSELLFQKTIDQVAHYSEDYHRLRSFLVHWYAAHRTMTSTQKNVSDVFFLPETHLDELFKSFGFNFSASINDFVTKVNFFLELVNLYKIKGTPLSLSTALQYFGYKDSNIVEYYLQKDNRGQLIFKPHVIGQHKAVDLNLHNVNFSTFTKLDSHWMQSFDDIQELLKRNKISLPSKTPYFGLRPIYDFKSVEPVLYYFFRLISNYYKTWKNTGQYPPKDIVLEELNFEISILELYIASLYVFVSTYGSENGSDAERFIINNYDEIPEYQTFKDNYLNDLKRPDTRDERKPLINNFIEKYTKKTDEHFLVEYGGTLGQLLEQLNSDLKQEIDAYIVSGKTENLIVRFINKLNTWMEINIDTSFPEFATIVLGMTGLVNIQKVIEFFKPYRARFLAFEIEYQIDRPLLESVSLKDFITDYIYIKEAVDFPCANSHPCIDDSNSYDSRLYLDCGSWFDTGIVDDGAISDDTFIEYTQELHEDNWQACPDQSNDEEIEQDYKYLDLGNERFDPKIKELQLISEFHQHSGWGKGFDDDKTFDCYSGIDLFFGRAYYPTLHFEEQLITEYVLTQIEELIDENVFRICCDLEESQEITSYMDGTSVTHVDISTGFCDYDSGTNFDDPCRMEVVELYVNELD